jgi:hypothetical protein
MICEMEIFVCGCDNVAWTEKSDRSYVVVSLPPRRVGLRREAVLCHSRTCFLGPYRCGPRLQLMAINPQKGGRG